MRLTLRTLLAWLDDTLPPAEVREIGKQVNESEVARDLVERINKVTRQRRLTVPHTSGPDATDPNIVAEYLDNVLSPEGITGFEKHCLRSDVHLAEVASVHQILSLLGQKAKVPPEARNRMYHLIKGREVTPASIPRASRQPRMEPTATPPPWAPSESPRRSNMERFGPPVAVVVLISLISLTTWLSLQPEEPTPNPEAQVALNSPPPDVAKPNVGAPGFPPAVPRAGPDLNAPAGLNPSMVEAPEARPEPAAAAKVDVMPVEPRAEAAANPANANLLPANTLGQVGDDPGLVLRSSGPDAEWERLEGKDQLKAGDVVVGLDPFRSSLKLGDGRLLLVRRASVKLQAVDRSQAARFELLGGQVVLTGTTPAKPYAVILGESVLLVTPKPNARVGVERINRLVSGQVESAEPVLVVFSGASAVELGGSAGSETLPPSGVIRFSKTNKFDDQQQAPTPTWVSETAVPALEQEVGRQFLRYFKDENPPLTSLAEATLADQPEIRRYAIEALGEIGQISLVVGALNTAGDPLVRKAAIEVLRDQLARGGSAADQVHEELVRYGGSEDWAQLVEKLLAGYSLAEARDPEVQANLVALLEHADVGVRELALHNLLAISNRADALGYDPDDPTGDGLAAWQDLLQRKEIRKPSGEPAKP